MAAGSDLTRAVFFNTEDYVKARRKPGGGFGATPKLPATVEDTYHSLRIISSISPLIQTDFSKEIRRRPELSSFLSRFLEKDLELGPRGIFQLLWCMKYCNIPPEEGRIADILSRYFFHNLKRENLYFALRIILEIQDIARLTEIPEPLKRAGLRNPFSGILKRRMMSIYLDRNLNWCRIPRRDAAGWFSACQNPDGGFGFMPGTTSYIENCHYGLSSLMLLDAEPADARACWNFIMGCRTISGGFSRNSSAAPFLDATWHAVKSLLILYGKTRS